MMKHYNNKYIDITRNEKKSRIYSYFFNFYGQIYTNHQILINEIKYCCPINIILYNFFYFLFIIGIISFI